MKILITGCAGFIGYHLISSLVINKNNKVYGIDNLNNYYDLKLKKDRLKILFKNKNFKFDKIDLRNNSKLENYFKKNKFDYVVNLAAQAGVRYSILNPKTYLDNNINGFFNVLNQSKNFNIKHFIFASTSSVYGNTKKFPTKENANTDKPLSFYAASKKCNEVLAYSYSNIFKLPVTGMRFFTVYGSYGRPDMFLFKFLDNIYRKKELKLFNNGNHIRDFTHVDDVVAAIQKIIPSKPINEDNVPYQIYNIGSDKPTPLIKFIKVILQHNKKKSNTTNVEMQPGDVYKTHANIDKLKKNLRYSRKINLDKSIINISKWYKKYFNL